MLIVCLKLRLGVWFQAQSQHRLTEELFHLHVHAGSNIHQQFGRQLISPVCQKSKQAQFLLKWIQFWLTWTHLVKTYQVSVKTVPI